MSESEQNNESEQNSAKVFQITVVSAGLSQMSTTTKLGESIALKTAGFLREHGRQAEVKTVRLKELAQDIAVASVSFHISQELRSVMDTVSASDGLVVATPVVKASYSGLFKSFWDIVDPDFILNMPVALAATGGSERHALVPDTEMRSLFAFLRALATPTSILAANNDWGSSGLAQRETRVAHELGAFVLAGVRDEVMQAAGAQYRRSFDTQSGNNAGKTSDSADGQGLDAGSVQFDSALMRLAAGGLLASPSSTVAVTKSSTTKSSTTKSSETKLSETKLSETKLSEGVASQSASSAGVSAAGLSVSSLSTSSLSTSSLSTSSQLAESQPTRSQLPQSESDSGKALNSEAVKITTVKSPATSGKARHKWTKEVGAIDFFVNSFDSKATVVWRSRNEMVIKAGAEMRKEVPLNKDGSVGYSARFGQKIRDEHANQFKDYVTTEDIVLNSVNEVGLFLYFGGANGWLQMIDSAGKTLNEWTVA